MSGDINVMALVKGEERYVFLFDEDSRAETLRTLGRYASDSELSFSWYDAAVLSQKVRKVSTDTTEELGEHPICRRSEPACGEDDVDVTQFPLFEDLPPFEDFPPIDDLWIGDEPIG